VLASNFKTDSTETSVTAEWQTLKGQIKDETGLPLDSVRVVLPEFNQSATTNANGVFQFSVYAPPQERVRLEAYKNGFQPLLRDPSWSEQLHQYKMTRLK
jgi:hypothetical protein